jgi:hypothetical protein
VDPPHTADVTRAPILALALFVLSAGAAQARGNDHGGGGEGGEVRVAATCGRGTTGSLRVRADDGALELRFRLRQTRGRGAWRIAVVHERRVAARAARKTSRGEDSFELRQVLPDLQGSDTVVVRAWGPGGVGCHAAATLPA